MIKVEFKPDILTLGKETTVALYLSNVARLPVYKICLTLKFPSGVILLRGLRDIEIEKLDAGTSYTVQLQIRAEKIGTYYVTSPNFSYRGGDGINQRVTDLQLNLEVQHIASLPTVSPAGNPESLTQSTNKNPSPNKAQPSQRTYQAHPIRILFLAANPRDTDPLRLDQEIRIIDQRLRSSEYRDRFQVFQHWAVRVSDLQELLLRHKPHIVHFSGHGSKSGRIVLEDDNGSATSVSPDALRNLFHILKKDVRCVVLNACFSFNQADAIANEIDCVVGMSQAIGDESAKQFAGSFYQGLGYGENIAIAFELGCNAIDLSGLGDEDKPKLLTRKDVKADNIIFL